MSNKKEVEKSVAEIEKQTEEIFAEVKKKREILADACTQAKNLKDRGNKEIGSFEAFKILEGAPTDRSPYFIHAPEELAKEYHDTYAEFEKLVHGPGSYIEIMYSGVLLDDLIPLLEKMVFALDGILNAIKDMAKSKHIDLSNANPEHL